MALCPSAQAALLLPLGTPLTLVTRVAAIGRPEGVGGSVGYRMTCVDLQDEEVPLAPVTDPALLAAAREALRGGHRVLCDGSFGEAPCGPGSGRGRGRKGFVLRLAGIARLRAVSPLLCPTEEEQAATAALLLRLGEAGLLPHLRQTLHLLLGVNEASLSPRLRLAERAALYLALSTGQVDARTNPRASLLLASRPGLGKKLLAETQLLLQPTACVVQAGMATPAGLSAAVSQSAGRGLHARPGLLAQHDGGAVVIEDIHRFEPGQLHAIRDVLCSVLEDGRLIAAKSARADFQARTALQVSVNRRSDLQGAGGRRGRPRTPGERLLDLHLTLDVASRFDLLIDLDVGDDAAAAARAMLASPPKLPEADAARATRQLRLLIAALRDRHPEVDLRPVGACLGRCLDEAALVLAELAPGAEGDLKVESLLRRLTNTLKKAVAAEARLHQRERATAADVDSAFAVVQLKVRAIAGLHRDAGEPRAPWPALVDSARAAAATRRRLIEARFLGEAASAEELAQALDLPLPVAERHLLAHGRPLPDGRYALAREGEEAADTTPRRPPGSPRPAADVAGALRILQGTGALCVVLEREALSAAAAEPRVAICERPGAALELLAAGWHPALAQGERDEATAGPSRYPRPATPGALAGAPAAPGPLVLAVTDPDRRDLRTLAAALYRRWDRGAAPRLHLAIFAADVEETVAALEGLGVCPGGAYDTSRLTAARPGAAPRLYDAGDLLPGLSVDGPAV